MKRLFSCVLLTALLCCGCGSTEKPKPIHLDEQGGGALSLLLPGQNHGAATATKAPGTGSEVLGNLLGESDDVPVVEGFDTQTLHEQYTGLRDETDAALADDTIDRVALRTKIQQLSGVVSLQAAQVKTANLNAADAEKLERFYQSLSQGLSAMLDELKQ